MHKLSRSGYLIVAVLISLIVANSFRSITIGDSVELPFRSDQMANSTASATTTHLISFQISDTSQLLGSIELQFCSNDPFIQDPCTAPAGFDDSGAVLSNQSGNTGFSISSASTSNNIVLTRTPATPTTAQNTYQFDNVVNPNTDGAYYIRLSVYPTQDASGTPTQIGGIAFDINEAITVNAYVPPYLNFCAGVVITNYDCQSLTNYVIDMGDLSSLTPNIASSQFTAATNSATGYIVTVAGTTLTSGNNTITASSVPSTSAPGISSFGINLRANNDPTIGNDPVGPGIVTVAPDYDIPNEFTFNDGDTLVTTSTSSDNKLFTVSYDTNVSPAQASGVYATTLTYICLANF